MKRVTLFRDFVEDGRTSMERYADQLAFSLEATDRENYVVKQYRPRLGSLTRKLPQVANLRMRYGRYVDYPRQSKKVSADIFHIVDHGYAHLLKVLDPAKAIVTVHDMIPLLAGRGLIPGVTLRRNWLAEYSSTYLRRAARIIAVSENTKRDIIRYCGCEPGRIEVIYSGLGNGFGRSEEEKVDARKALGLPGEPVKLVLITGAEYYKNHPTSLAVMQLLQERYGDGIALVRLGQDSREWQGCLENSAFSGKIMQLSNLTAEQVIRLYSTVDCLLFPSWYEGFGWPPLEAMACGTPAVTSNRASLPEVMGDAGPTFEADDVEGMAAAIEKLLFDADYRAGQIDRGIKQAAKFNWESAARQVQRVYDTLH